MNEDLRLVETPIVEIFSVSNRLVSYPIVSPEAAEPDALPCQSINAVIQTIASTINTVINLLIFLWSIIEHHS